MDTAKIIHYEGEAFIILFSTSVVFSQSNNFKDWLYQPRVKYAIDDGTYIGHGSYIVICGLRFINESRGRKLVSTVMTFCATLLLSLLCLTACGTVSPDFPHAREVAFGDSGRQDANIWGQVVDPATGVHYLLLTNSERLKFNNDLTKYGTLLNPPVKPNEGWISHGKLFAVRNDIFVDFYIMEEFSARDAGSQ